MPIEKETFVSTYLVAEEGLSQGITTPASYCVVESLCVSAKTEQFSSERRSWQPQNVKLKEE